MSNKPRIILHVLAVATLMEAGAGLYEPGGSLLHFAFPRYFFLFNHFGPGARAAFYAMTFANLIFIVLLVVSGVLLWRLQRRGLTILTCTVVAEILYVVGVAAASLSSESIRVADAIGNLGLSVQLFTGYPLVAGVLVFVAYRNLGIPTREVV